MSEKKLDEEQIKACRERIVKLKASPKWPVYHWFNDEDFETALNTIADLTRKLAAKEEELATLNAFSSECVTEYRATTKALTSRISQLEGALKKIIKAWESLRGGQNYSPKIVENWLIKKMKPAIDFVRKSLKEKTK